MSPLLHQSGGVSSRSAGLRRRPLVSPSRGRPRRACGQLASSFPLVLSRYGARRLLRTMFSHNVRGYSEILRPPAPDGLPVRTIPPSEVVAVVEVVEDDGLRAKEQGRLDGNYPVAGDPAVLDEALVPLADSGRGGAVGGSSRDGDVSQARRFVERAGKELVDLGDGGEIGR